VDAIPLISKRGLEAADLRLEARVVDEVDVGVEQLDGVVEVLERKLPVDRFGGGAFEVDATAGVVEATAGVDPGRRPGVSHPVELRHAADAERKLPVAGRYEKAAVIEVVVGDDVYLAEVEVADLLGLAEGRRVAAAS
jgi:hypothetical protein